MAWNPGQMLQDGKYTLESKLGRGRFAITYLAKDRNGKELVIKTLDEDLLNTLPQKDRDSINTKFVNEGRKLERCKHTHVVSLLDTFMEGQLFCLAMEYIHGDTLESIVRVRKFLPEQEALGYIRQIGEALIEVHKQGLLHRDVKPENIIVRVIDLFQEEDTHCLVMDFIEGESLGERVRRRGKLTEAEAVEYIRQIGSALIEVHKANLVHRDVHPGNIMLRSSGKAVLIDFGISGEMFPTTMTSKHFGNKAFAPYEQQRQGSRHPTVDIYTLAASLYYALTGELPTNSFDRKYDRLELVPPKRLVPTISNEVNQAILKGMALEPENRPQSMQEWLKLLEPKQVDPVSTPQPVQPSPQRSPIRNGRSISRGRLNTKFTLSPLHVVLLVATLAAPVGALIGWQYPFLSSKPQVSPREPNLPINAKPESLPLNSEKEVDYSKLQNLLAQGKWKEADNETADVMLKVGGREKEGWLDIASIQKLSCTDLRTIDNLWVKYSQGRFGFSVQKRIWESVAGIPADYESYERFGDRVEWRVNSEWLGHNNSTFTTKAPDGHLPAKTLYNRGYMRRELPGFFSHVETCKV